MPAEDIWQAFFNVELILSELHINSEIDNLVEIGCGYGTFTIPTAKHISGTLYAFDIEKEMLDIVTEKIPVAHLDNIILEQRDVLTQTTELADNSIDYIMLFNILHNDLPDLFFKEANRILKPEGKVGILHWRSDISTPRGPDLSIRPNPDQILLLADNHKFSVYKAPFIIEPYHFGLILSKTSSDISV